MPNTLNTIKVGGKNYTVEDYLATKNVGGVRKNQPLDKQAFLQLLCTQLKYQDPLEPQDNAAFIAQLAQFSSLEAMTNMSEGMLKLTKRVQNIDTSLLVGQLSSMIGKNIEWVEQRKVKDPTTGEEKTTKVKCEGKVKAVSITDGNPSVVAVDKKGKTINVEVSSLTRVGDK